jgi:acetolactate synthase I/II/III large subunit
MTTAPAATTVAEAFLALLKARGIDYLLANAGTDFAPVIEGLVRGAGADLAMPEPLAISHETVAIGMAHGYYLATGRPQAVMVHVNVGAANALMGVINAARDNVPILFTSGRTPITEAGRLGSRDLPIHWGQEMRDQGAMLREHVKWDYELRDGGHIAPVLDRALAIAMSEPRGPVYLSLPREVLAAPLGEAATTTAPALVASSAAHPEPAAIEAAADLVARAERPLIVTSRAGRSPRAWAALAGLAAQAAVPVVEFWPQQSSLASDHPLHGGFDVEPWLDEVDLVLVVDAMVPWIPSRKAPPPGCTVIGIGPDPAFSDLPVRLFPMALGLAGDVGATLELLHAALEERLAGQVARLAERRGWVQDRGEQRRAATRRRIDEGRRSPMSHAWISHCIDRAKGEDAVVVNELGADPAALTLARRDGYFGHSLAGGLGWGLPAALGIQLADRERPVIATVGDGSYLFANPVACHQTAEALGLPVLTVVFNNGVWDAVQKSTRSVYPDGHAARANRMPLASLEPSPAYELVAQASRAHAERVEDPEALPAALERALAAVRTERRPALLNVLCR